MDRRERLLEAATRLFYEQGYQAVGLDAILAESGVSKTSFYKSFSSIEELALSCVKHHGERWVEDFLAAVRRAGGDNPVEQLRAIFKILDDWVSSENFSGCLLIRASAEFPQAHDPRHAAAVGALCDLERSITAIVEHAGVDDPAVLTRRLLIVVRGACMDAVIHRDAGTGKAARELAGELIENAIAESSGISGTGS